MQTCLPMRFLLAPPWRPNLPMPGLPTKLKCERCHRGCIRRTPPVFTDFFGGNRFGSKGLEWKLRLCHFNMNEWFNEWKWFMIYIIIMSFVLLVCFALYFCFIIYYSEGWRYMMNDNDAYISYTYNYNSFARHHAVFIEWTWGLDTFEPIQSCGEGRQVTGVPSSLCYDLRTR